MHPLLFALILLLGALTVYGVFRTLTSNMQAADGVVSTLQQMFLWLFKSPADFLVSLLIHPHIALRLLATFALTLAAGTGLFYARSALGGFGLPILAVLALLMFFSVLSMHRRYSFQKSYGTSGVFAFWCPLMAASLPPTSTEFIILLLLVALACWAIWIFGSLTTKRNPHTPPSP